MTLPRYTPKQLDVRAADTSPHTRAFRQVTAVWDAGTWREQARCRDLPSAEAERLFFPGNGHHSREAKEFCAECPVANECLNWALGQPPSITQGLYAGVGEVDRRNIRRRYKRTNRPTKATGGGYGRS